MIDQLRGLRKRDQPLTFIPDWLHPTMSSSIRSMPSKIGRSPRKPIRLLYSGNIGGKQGLLDFCKVLAGSDAAFHFQINGDGGGAAQVREFIESAGDNRFSIGPLVDEADFVKALHDTDLFVITEKQDKRASFFPSKTIPGITSGTPILAVSNEESPLGREARTYEIGPWFRWEDCGKVGETLSSLSRTPDLFRQWQENAIRRASFYDRDRCLDLFEQTIRDLIRASDFEPVSTLSGPAVVTENL